MFYGMGYLRAFCGRRVCCFLIYNLKTDPAPDICVYRVTVPDWPGLTPQS